PEQPHPFPQLPGLTGKPEELQVRTRRVRRAVAAEPEQLVQDPVWWLPGTAWMPFGGQGPVADRGRNVPAEALDDVAGRVQRRVFLAVPGERPPEPVAA